MRHKKTNALVKIEIICPFINILFIAPLFLSQNADLRGFLRSNLNTAERNAVGRILSDISVFAFIYVKSLMPYIHIAFFAFLLIKCMISCDNKNLCGLIFNAVLILTAAALNTWLLMSGPF